MLIRDMWERVRREWIKWAGIVLCLAMLAFASGSFGYWLGVKREKDIKPVNNQSESKAVEVKVKEPYPVLVDMNKPDERFLSHDGSLEMRIYNVMDNNGAMAFCQGAIFDRKGKMLPWNTEVFSNKILCQVSQDDEGNILGVVTGFMSWEKNNKFILQQEDESYIIVDPKTFKTTNVPVGIGGSPFQAWNGDNSLGLWYTNSETGARFLILDNDGTVLRTVEYTPSDYGIDEGWYDSINKGFLIATERGTWDGGGRTNFDFVWEKDLKLQKIKTTGLWHLEGMDCRGNEIRITRGKIFIKDGCIRVPKEEVNSDGELELDLVK